jgi:Ran GTPase-activating protein (RanGAP) involved in mRNA processing and transport
LMQLKQLSSVNKLFADGFNVLHTWDSLKTFLTPLFSLEIYCFMWVADYWMKELIFLKYIYKKCTTNEIIEKRRKVLSMVAKVHQLHRFFLGKPFDQTLANTVESWVHHYGTIIQQLDSFIPFVPGLNWGTVTNDQINEITMLSLSGVIELAHHYTQSAVLTRPFYNGPLDHQTPTRPKKLQLIRPEDHEKYILRVAIHFGLLPELNTIQINSNTIDDGLLTTIVSVPNLHTLSLTEMNIDDKGMVAFSSKLSPNSMTSLTSLNMRDNKIGTDSMDGMNAFVAAINEGALANLKKLSLSNNIIGNEGMNALSGIRSGARASLTDLWLNKNEIGDDGMRDFSQWLTWSVDESIWLKKLTLLDLSDNEIGQTGMKEFSTALKSKALANLEVLDLSDNLINDTCIGYFCAAASMAGVLSKLQQLYLNNNPIRGAGMTQLSNLLGDHLQDLQLLRVLGEDVPFEEGREVLKERCDDREIVVHFDVFDLSGDI